MKSVAVPIIQGDVLYIIVLSCRDKSRGGEEYNIMFNQRLIRFRTLILDQAYDDHEKEQDDRPKDAPSRAVTFDTPKTITGQVI